MAPRSHVSCETEQNGVKRKMLIPCSEFKRAVQDDDESSAVNKIKKGFCLDFRIESSFIQLICLLFVVSY